MSTIPYKVFETHAKTTFYCGLDVHKYQLAVAIYGTDSNGQEILKYATFTTDPQGLSQFWNFSAKYKPQGYVMETTGIYHHTISLYLENMREKLKNNFEICVVNPADASGIPNRQKNDRIDAEQLAKYYAHNLLKKGKSINVIYEDLKALFRANDRLETERTQLKNRIKRTLDRAGFRPKRFNLNHECSKAFLHKLTQYNGTIKGFIDQFIQEKLVLEKHRRHILKYLPEIEPFFELKLTNSQRILVRQSLFDLDLKYVVYLCPIFFSHLLTVELF